MNRAILILILLVSTFASIGQNIVSSSRTSSPTTTDQVVNEAIKKNGVNVANDVKKVQEVVKSVEDVATGNVDETDLTNIGVKKPTGVTTKAVNDVLKDADTDVNKPSEVQKVVDTLDKLNKADKDPAVKVTKEDFLNVYIFHIMLSSRYCLIYPIYQKLVYHGSSLVRIAQALFWKKAAE